MLSQEPNRKYVFICGLHRSGTSLLGRNIARLENCTGFRNTGVLMDEGQYLQDVYPPDRAYGGAGRYGFDPRAHLVETSPLLTPGNVARLRASWHAFWDNNKTICVEKTPGNLLMTRFLQAAFPKSFFVVIRRHPVAVSMATQRWKVSVTAIHRLLEHWLHCYGVFEKDKKYLKHVYELRYEDYVDDPDRYHQKIARFLDTRVPEPPKEDKFRYVLQWPNPMGLRVPERATEETTGAHNMKYFDRWSNLLTNSPLKSYYRYIAMKYEPDFAKYGYSLTKGFELKEAPLHSRGKLSDAIGAFYCHAADTGAFIRRLSVRSNTQLRVTAKAVLPEFVVTRIRQARQRQPLNKERVEARR
jgi:hypothetical protein